MRRLALTTALFLLTLLPHALTPARHAAVARAAQKCPAVTVTCPGSVRHGEQITFTAGVDAAAADVNYTFNWEVSAGTITDGQGRPAMTVESAGVNAAVVATVEVGGLPPACDRHASCASRPAAFVCGHSLDEYGDIPFEAEQARLDNLAIELQSDLSMTGYMVCYGGRVGYEGEARARCDRAKEYLSKVRGINADRVAAVDGGFKESLNVVMWVVPPGATPPQPTPTVDPAEVKINKPKPVPKPRRR